MHSTSVHQFYYSERSKIPTSRPRLYDCEINIHIVNEHSRVCMFISNIFDDKFRKFLLAERRKQAK